jgi:NitT/TauT family transport system substrate-binding protein
MTKNNIIITAVVAGIVLISIFAYGTTTRQEGSKETSKVKIGYLQIAQSLPLFVAQEKGYFKDAGLEVNTVKFEAPNLYSDAMISGQIDASANSLATGIMSIAETKNPGKFQIYGTNYADIDNPADVVVVAKDSPIQSFADLKGKTCVTLSGPQFKVIFNKLAKDAGLKTSEVGKDGDIFYKELPVTELVTALGSKTADCIVGVEPVGTVAISKNVGRLLNTSPISKVFGGRFYGGMSAVSTDFKNKNPETTKKLVDAMDKAISDIQKDPQSTRQYLAKGLGIAPDLANNMKLQHFRSSTDLNEDDFKGIDSFLNEFQNQGIYTTKPDFRKLTYKN